MVKVGNQGLDDRYIRLRSHRISHPVLSGLRQSHSITFSRPGFRPGFYVWFRSTKKLWQKTKTQILRMRPTSFWKFYKLRGLFWQQPYKNQLLKALTCIFQQQIAGPLICKSLQSPIATTLQPLAFLPIYIRVTNRTMYSNVRLDILKFSFHHSSTELVSRPRPRTSNAPCLAQGNLQQN